MKPKLESSLNPNSQAPYFEQVVHGPVSANPFDNCMVLRKDIRKAVLQNRITPVQGLQLGGDLLNLLHQTEDIDAAWSVAQASSSDDNAVETNVIHVNFRD